MDFGTLTCAMMLYSFIGWFYESTVFSLVEQGKFMNRGCFIGPYCPIYSVVSILNVYLLNGIESGVKIVIISSLTCCFIEYITSWGLEKIFHARYWDYSYFPLNINGRVSVVSGLFFGFAVLFLIKILHPYVIIKLSLIPDNVRYYLAVFFWGIFIFDAIFTTISMCNLNKKCKQLYDAWDDFVDGKLDILNAKKDSLNKFVIVRKGKNLIVKLKGVNTMFVDMETRFFKAFPSFKSTDYGEITDQLMHVVADDFDENNNSDASKSDSSIDNTDKTDNSEDNILDGNTTE